MVGSFLRDFIRTSALSVSLFVSKVESIFLMEGKSAAIIILNYPYSSIGLACIVIVLNNEEPFNF